MNKFEEGDTAWYFVFPEDGCGGFDVSMVYLRENKSLTKAEIEYCHYLIYSYKSKQEALDSMYKRLEEIKNEC